MLQGSCISSLLCSLYLADMEKTHLLRLLPDLHPSASLSSSSGPGLSDLGAAAGALLSISFDLFQRFHSIEFT